MNPSCNLCGSTSFKDVKARKKASCAACGSLERTRAIKLMIDNYAPLDANSRVLHVAPEMGLAKNFQEVVGSNCTFADIEPERFTTLKNVQRLDLCSDLASMPANEFDLIVHSHVLEHVPCNYTYVLYHLHRLMKPDGRMICCIPIMGGHYDACTNPGLSDEDRNQRFGQADHVTRFGRNDLGTTLGTVYNLPETYDITRLLNTEDLLAANVPETSWRGYTPDTILLLNKRDYQLA